MTLANCEWVDRVSAFIDGELPEVERPLVQKHLARCGSCESMVRINNAFQQHHLVETKGTSVGLADKTSPALKIAVGLFGLLNLIVAIPNFINGSTMGDEMHTLRHLAIWQATLGISVIAVARTFRFSRFVKVATITFLLATTAAGIYDLATGHSGPWKDPAHLLEIGALIMILVVAKPQFRILTRIRNSRTNRKKTARQRSWIRIHR